MTTTRINSKTGNDTEKRRRSSLSRWIPSCLVIVLAVVPALWLVSQFETARDREFPGVDRSTYSEFPPRAYRWAEPGDTLDKLALYAATAGLIIAGSGWWRSRNLGKSSCLWPAAFSIFASASWHACTPWPTPDGWHGLNWHAILDPSAPWSLRFALAVALACLAFLAISAIGPNFKSPASRWTQSKFFTAQVAGGLMLVVARWIPSPLPGPPGYWSRWFFVWGLTVLAVSCVQALPRVTETRRARLWLLPALGLWIALIGGGRWLIWYQRPLDRLRVVVPGRIFLSAMPSYRGLELAVRRHRFRTIINVFNENTPQRSPRLPDELRFVKEHGLTYLGSPGDPLLADSFLDETLRLAQDPEAWPILVHCHGCMDRSPAWMGIYRFLVEDRPLDEILSEIEAHRGLRPKASVTLLYNRVLPQRAPERYASDSTARELVRNAHGTRDPFFAELEAARRRANEAEPERVGQVIPPDTRRP